MNQEKKRSTLLLDLLLLLVAIIWGGGFPAVQMSLKAGLTPLMSMFGRFSIATLIMGAAFYGDIKKATVEQVKYGMRAGFLVFLAFLTQTMGMKYTTPSNNAFLTATCVVMVPFISWYMLKMRPSGKHIAMTMLSFAGAIVLAYSPGMGIALNIGDILTLICAFLYALHVSYLGLISDKMPPSLSAFIQFATAATLSGFSILFLESDMVQTINFMSALMPVLYLGVFSTALCFFIQIYAQQKVAPTAAVIILSTESVFGSLFSVMLGLEPMRASLIIGGGMILSSIVCMEINFANLRLNKSEAEKEKV